jgi:L-amino acid N-acyltransferase YncA
MHIDNSAAAPRLILRDSSPDDVPACAEIYREAVRNGTGTFELEEPDDAEMGRRRDAILAQGLPWLVAERGGQVLGYAYANQFRPRRAYRFCV